MKRRVSRLEDVFAEHVTRLVPLAEQKNTRDDLPQMVNFVSTVEMLPSGGKYRFPLEAIAAQVGSNVQYGPLKFAADILRLRDRTSDSTALVFRSGKLVIVHCLSLEHSRFCCHLYRLLLETIQFVVCDPAQENRLMLTTLEGRTQFNNWKVHNTVGFGKLGCRVDLNALRESAPHVCQYKPDIFPGLKLRVWIHPQDQCMCNTLKCPCKVKMLIFDNGNVIIVGARSIRHVNQVFYRFKALVPQYIDESAPLPRALRFEARMARLLDDEHIGVPLEHVTSSKKIKKKIEVDEEDQDVLNIMMALKTDSVSLKDADDDNVHIHKKSKKETDDVDTLTVFLKACMRGQEANVRWMLSMNRAEHLAERDARTGFNAIELLETIPVDQRSEQHINILQMLKQK